MNLLDTLIETLKTDERFLADGKLLKNKIIENAFKLDTTLISTLVNKESLKKIFFQELSSGIVIFDKDKFIQFISNKEFLPDSYTAFKNKIGLSSDQQYLKASEKIVLVWPYKDCILEGGQDREDSKSNEIFWNEILAPDEVDRLLDPKVLTNIKHIDKEGSSSINAISSSDNLVIRGNNLLALHSLKDRYVGQVKLIYIDPPYNTGSDSFKYNDSFNHSTWLTFMKNRLEIAKKLLHPSGSIFVQCDDNEQAYLKVLMDELFGEDNFLSSLVIKAKSSAGASGGGEDKKLKKNYESILIYGMKDFSKFKKLYENEYLEDIIKSKQREKKSYEYNKVFISSGTKEEHSFITSGSGEKIPVFQHNDYEIKSIKQLAKEEKLGLYETYKKYYKSVFRTQDAESSIRHKVVEATSKSGNLYSIVYIPKSGKNKNKTTELFYYKNEMVNFLTNVTSMENGEIIKHTILGTLWTDLGWDGIANEGGVKLKAGKKPEKLLQRIIEMSTDEEDLVLDYHLGSGTTCAVAHKMKRRYIGIEQMDYGKNDPTIRLKNVINGDKSGISSSLKWEGGGSFVYAELMKYNEVYIEEIQKATNKQDIKKILTTLKNEVSISYKIDFSLFDNTFNLLTLNEQQKFLIEILDKNQLYVNFSEIDDNSFNIQSTEKEFNKQFYKKD